MFDLTHDGGERRELRPHQVKAIEGLRQSLARGNKRVVLQAPTGFGKTLTTAKIIENAREKGHKVLFTVPRLSLVGQAVDEFEREGIRHIGVMQAQHPRTDPTAPVQVATVQTLTHRIAGMDQFPLVIVDECHETFKAIYALMQAWPESWFVGLSATPWSKGMGQHWQDLIQAASIGDLIEAGYLSQFTAFAPDVPDVSKVKISKGDYVERELAGVMGEKKLVGNIVQTWLSKGENRPTLVFGVNRSHAEQLQYEFIHHGIAAGYIDCNTDRLTREKLARDFKAGEIRVACSCRTLTTGIDWPVSCIVDAAPTRSEMLHVQKIGRGLRVNAGTEDCLILDHAGNSLRLGLVTDIHHALLDDGTKREASEPSEATEKLPKPCPKCEVLFIGKVCPACGHERKPPTVEAEEGELVQITGKQKAYTMAEKQVFWSMALWLDDERQRGGKLAKGLYKGKFGVWPQGLSHQRKAPDMAFFNYEKSRRIAYAKKMAKDRGQS
jgi:DNA repair protein RadD